MYIHVHVYAYSEVLGHIFDPDLGAGYVVLETGGKMMGRWMVKE